MIADTYADLDKLVEEEMKKVPLPPTWNAGFTPNYGEPGQGEFSITGEFNNANFIYRLEYSHLMPYSCFRHINLQKHGNILQIYADKDGIQHISVNDRNYNTPLPGAKKKESWETKTESEDERDDALTFGKEVLDAVEKYLQNKVPALMELINGYYSRSLMAPESQPQYRSNKEIFDKFDLTLKKD